jgi:hypothetical protein
LNDFALHSEGRILGCGGSEADQAGYAATRHPIRPGNRLSKVFRPHGQHGRFDKQLHGITSAFCQLKSADPSNLDDVTTFIRFAFPALLAASAFAQTQPASSDSGTSNDLFVMFGSDVVRPSLAPKANYNIGLGHTFKFLGKDPIGDEITFAYTYENGGSHGFLHTDFGSHTEALGLMKNFPIHGTKRVTGYTWIQGGITSMTGTPIVENRFYDGEALGAIVHFSDHHSIWIQEMYNKIVSVPWYTTASIGYTRSW